MLIVELRAAKIPWIGYLAVHYWYGIIRSEHSDRWEVWQTPGLSRESWGHLHKNLMPVTAGVGNGDSWIAAVWEGDLALRLAHIIETSPEYYPYCRQYRYFPGPNSNTYGQWVLTQAGLDYRLGFKALGQHYPQLLGWPTSL